MRKHIHWEHNLLGIENKGKFRFNSFYSGTGSVSWDIYQIRDNELKHITLQEWYTMGYQIDLLRQRECFSICVV